LLACNSFVEYCPHNVFQYDAVNDKVTVNDPMLVTEFNDQTLGRKVGDSGRRVMDYVTLKFKPSFHFRVEVRRRVVLPARCLPACLPAWRVVGIRLRPSRLLCEQSTGCMPSWKIVQVALAEMKKKLVRQPVPLTPAACATHRGYVPLPCSACMTGDMCNAGVLFYIRTPDDAKAAGVSIKRQQDHLITCLLGLLSWPMWSGCIYPLSVLRLWPLCACQPSPFSYSQTSLVILGWLIPDPGG
jgi:hypothetical protein